MSDGRNRVSSGGSHWHRWDPHIHTPGTRFNDQFKGPDAWEKYLESLETTSPPIRAIGIADYYDTENYLRLRSEKANGRLPDCGLIFPNIEMRLAVGTVKGFWVNTF